MKTKKELDRADRLREQREKLMKGLINVSDTVQDKLAQHMPQAGPDPHDYDILFGPGSE